MTIIEKYNAVLDLKILLGEKLKTYHILSDFYLEKPKESVSTVIEKNILDVC